MAFSNQTYLTIMEEAKESELIKMTLILYIAILQDIFKLGTRVLKQIIQKDLAIKK